MNEAVKTALAVHRASDHAQNPTLLVDDDPVTVGAFKEERGVARLSALGLAPGEMWALAPLAPFGLAVLSAPRSAREILRALVLVSHRVTPGGRVLLLPFAGDMSDETRPEALDVFCGAYPRWVRGMLAGGVLELRKVDVTLSVSGREVPLDLRGAAEMLGPAAVAAMPKEGEKFAGRIEGAVLGSALSWQTATPPAVDPNSVLPKIEAEFGPTLYGKKKRVVSLAVFGAPEDADKHWRRMPDYLACWVRAHHALFPGYELRIHHDDYLYRAHYGGALHGLQRRGLVKLVRMPARPGQGKCEKMLWRLAPTWDPSVSHVFCRDVDSLPTWRDRCASEEFVESGYALGTIHDNVMHAGVMGGLCHVDARQFREATGCATFEEFVAAAKFSDERWARHGADQDYLNHVVKWVPGVLEHSLFAVGGEGGSVQRRSAPTIKGTRVEMRPTLATPSAAVLAGVTPEVRAGSGALANYMGAAGFDTARALEFYERHSPVASAVWEAEQFAGADWAPLGYAVISSDANLDYAFLASLACLAWQHWGYRPLLLIVGTAGEWLASPKLRLVLERCRETGALVHFVAALVGARTSTTAQCARIFAAGLPGVKDGDFLVTSDADMLPLGPWATTFAAGEGLLHLLYANAYSGGPCPHDGKRTDPCPHFPMCYIGAEAKTWREVVGCALDGMESALADMLAGTPRGDEALTWNYDERWLGDRIRAWSGFAARARLVDRADVEGQWRVDRSAWARAIERVRERGTVAGVADAHLPRPGWTDECWSGIRLLLSLLLPADRLAWADEYRATWMALGA